MAGVGPLTQLAATGPQDCLINNLPYDTSPHWKRYTRFATTAKDLDFPTGLDFGGTAQVTVPYSTADVLSSLTLQVGLPAVGPGWTWRPGAGRRLLRKYRVMLGDVTLCDLDGLFLDIASQLHSSAAEATLLRQLVGGASLDASTPHTLYIPLRLLYTSTTNEGLPLIAMTNSRVQVDITLAPLDTLLTTANPPAVHLTSCKLLMDLAFLGAAEKATFLAKPLVVLPEWVLYQDFSTIDVTNNHDSFVKTSMNVDLSFVQGLVKQLILVFVDTAGDIVDCLNSCTLQANNNPVGEVRSAGRMRSLDAYYGCVACPQQPVYVINFALHTSSRQPSGVLDTDQLSACSLSLSIAPHAPAVLRVYSVAYRRLIFGSSTVSAV